MPRISQRKLILQRLEKEAFYYHEMSKLEGMPQSFVDYYQASLSQLLNWIEVIGQQRYLLRGSEHITTTNHIDSIGYCYGLPAYLFKKFFRMDKNSFDNLASLIHGANLQPLLNVPSKQRKAPVALQLFVTLRILGHYGNANTFHDVSALLRVSYGACDKYYKRIIDCLVIISQRYVKWPDIDERKQISSSVQADFCFPNCVGMIDGTVFPLFAKASARGGRLLVPQTLLRNFGTDYMRS